MKTVTIRDLRTNPRAVRETLKSEGETILTASGRPVAVMISVDAGTVDETLETLRRARGLEALRSMRTQSRQRGLNRLSSKEVVSIIARTRRDTRAR
ncbi:MAG: type II toxin-antitoxin system Phd/YefM family antitoxin [Acidobacteria bacterium]|nr:type II toxin-antitoxin system Phd/YefM family antitoxin [Acidobacteriota bacterium]